MNEISSNLRIRRATLQDLSTLMLIERESYPSDMHADEGKMKERIDVFSEGQFIVYLNAEPVGYATNQIVHFKPDEKGKTWLQMTNGGYIANTHDVSGNALHFVSTGVRPPFRRHGIGSFIYDRRLEMAKDFDLEFTFGDFRIQTFRYNLEQMYGIKEREFLRLEDSDIRVIGKDYLEKIRNGVVSDPINILFRRGFILLDIVPWYMGDVESLHMGAIMYKDVK